MAILVAALQAAVAAAEDVRGRRTVLVEGREESGPFGPVGQAGRLADRGNGVRPVRRPLLRPRAAEELGGVAAVGPPLFLLPAREARRAAGDFLDHVVRHGVPRAGAADAVLVGKRG